MVEQIKKPNKGFEEIIWRHFYIKRDVILKEAGKWVKMASVRPCTYGGLVSDHNYKYSNRFNTHPMKYVKELTTALKDLEEALK